MSATLDSFTQAHLQAWLNRYQDDQQREDIRADIEIALAADPEAIERGRSWPELRDTGQFLRQSGAAV